VIPGAYGDSAGDRIEVDETVPLSRGDKPQGESLSPQRMNGRVRPSTEEGHQLSLRPAMGDARSVARTSAIAIIA
jgi:hypothetical protein